MKILFTILIAIQFSVALNAQTSGQIEKFYKYGTGFILQELKLEMHPQHHPQFAGKSALLSEYGEYYMFEEEDFSKSLNENSFSLDLGKKIIEPNSNIYTLDSKGEYQNLRINYTSGITQILYLDDTGIIIINERFYAVRYLKYAYLDRLDLQYKDREDGELRAIDSTTTRLFLYTQKLLPYPAYIEGIIWKHKHELSEFWQPSLSDFDFR